MILIAATRRLSGTWGSYLCETNGLACFVQVQEVKELVKEDVLILGHSSIFPFTYSILASACDIF